MIELTPWMIDAILLIVVVEFFLFRSLLMRRDAKEYVAPLLLFLVSGALLLVALRLTLADANALLTSLALLLAGAAHLATIAAATRCLPPEHPVS